ncbi:MAG: glycosyltransferase, partial [Rickettsiaceae bacterium]|nr:glycosyltransferase [Rickettsiaceae bacterium]
MTKKNPKVSIIIPVYNGSNYLKDAINSALNQTYQNIEIIVVNDGSNDDGKTEEIALSYGDKIRYFSKPNGGVSTALNYGIDKMTGEYFSWLSHDDLYLPEKIATQIAKLNSLGTGKFILYSNVIYLIEKDNKEVPLSLKTIPAENFRYWLAKERALNGCALLIPKAAFSEIRIFDEDLRHTQDYDLWFDLATNYQFIHIPEFLVKFRCHDLQDSLKLPKIARLETDKLLSKFVTELTTEEITHATNTSLAISYR